jgi:hypothetical protein
MKRLEWVVPLLVMFATLTGAALAKPRRLWEFEVRGHAIVIRQAWVGGPNVTVDGTRVDFERHHDDVRVAWLFEVDGVRVRAVERDDIGVHLRVYDDEELVFDSQVMRKAALRDDATAVSMPPAPQWTTTTPEVVAASDPRQTAAQTLFEQLARHENAEVLAASELLRVSLQSAFEVLRAAQSGAEAHALLGDDAAGQALLDQAEDRIAKLIEHLRQLHLLAGSMDGDPGEVAPVREMMGRLEADQEVDASIRAARAQRARQRR